MDRDAFRSYFAMHNVDVHPVALDSGTAARRRRGWRPQRRDTDVGLKNAAMASPAAATHRPNNANRQVAQSVIAMGSH